MTDDSAARAEFEAFLARWTTNPPPSQWEVWQAALRASPAPDEGRDRLLRKFCQHLPDCRVIEGHRWPFRPQCSCGFDAALNALASRPMDGKP
jgi:hypothetical protein